MAYYVIKIIITSVLVVLVSEFSKKSTLFGGLLASLPIVSYFALIWLFSAEICVWIVCECDLGLCILQLCPGIDTWLSLSVRLRTIDQINGFALE